MEKEDIWIAMDRKRGCEGINHMEDNQFLNGIYGWRICIREKDMGCTGMIIQAMMFHVHVAKDSWSGMKSQGIVIRNMCISVHVRIAMLRRG